MQILSLECVFTIYLCIPNQVNGGKVLTSPRPNFLKVQTFLKSNYEAKILKIKIETGHFIDLSYL